MNRCLSLSLLALLLAGTPAWGAPMLKHTDVFVSGKDGYHTYRIPAIETAADGSLVAFAEARKYNMDDPGMGNNDIDLVMKRSTDGGATWSAMRIIEDPGEKWSAANPATVLDRSNGRLWLLYLRCKPGRSTDTARAGTDDVQTLARTSDDNGVTWSQPIDLTAVARDMKDRRWRSSVIGPGGVIQAQSGRLVAPVWKVDPWGVLAIFSDDHGRTWQRGDVMPGGRGGDENQVVELSDGRILMDVRQESGPHRWLSESRDGGKTWSVPRPGVTVTPVCCAIERYTLKSAGDDRDRILWTGPKGPGRSHLVVRTSYDEGRTFVNERLLWNQQAAYSDLTILKDKTVGVLWERGEKSGYQFITFTRFNREFLEPGGSAKGTAHSCGTALQSRPLAVKRPVPPLLFPCHLPGKQWTTFPAEGFGAQPACGVIFRTNDPVTNGMPLGGIDTGCVDLETSGMLGYATIYNTHVPRRGPLNVPILGLSIGGKTWLLCRAQPKDGSGGYQPSGAGAKYSLWRNGKYEQASELLTPVPMALNFTGLRTAREIDYWGHYPVADLEFQTDAPIGVGLRAWSPFLPGALVDSMLPGAVFEVHLRNPGPAVQSGTIAFSFPGPLDKEAGATKFQRRAIDGQFHGVEVVAPLASWALGVIGNKKPRLGGELGNNASAWAKIAEQLPVADPGQSGSSAAVDFHLAPGEVHVVRFAVTWHAPEWNAGGYNWAGAPHRFTHTYAKHYPSAHQAAETLAKNHAALLRRILAWQQVVYAQTSLPVWLRDCLVNNLHLITETGMWAQAKPPLPSWVRPGDGLFGMNECPRGCPQIECIPCSFYGNQPLVYFFPELALSTLRGYKGYQYGDGHPPWIFGGCTGQTPPIDFANPTKGYQWASNGISVAAMVDRFLMCHDTPDGKFLKEFYPVVKQWMIWTVGLRTTPSYCTGERVIAMPNPAPAGAAPHTEWFEAAQPGWAGMTAHIAGLHLAQLRITQRMARKIGDRQFAEQCETWIRAGAEAMEKRLWDPRGYYLNYFDPESGRKSEYVFGYQMDGQWITDHHGLPSALRPERVRTVLETIKRCNIKLSRSGAVNYADPGGRPYKPAKPGQWDYGAYSYFPPEALMLAMTYMYEGQREFGLELARKVWHNIVCLHGYAWDMPNIMRGDVDTGERTYGDDYYQDMMLWSLPAAIEGKDFAAPARPGGLVDRVLRASRAR